MSEEEYEDMEDPEESCDLKTCCDTCERTFFTVQQFRKHMSEHRTCGIDGCTFSAHGKIVDKHVSMQHRSGLYDKIRSISTPEDVAKWRAERKKNYPTKESIEERYKRQEEMIKRGERLQERKQKFAKKNDNRCKFFWNVTVLKLFWY